MYKIRLFAVCAKNVSTESIHFTIAGQATNNGRRSPITCVFNSRQSSRRRSRVELRNGSSLKANSSLPISLCRRFTIKKKIRRPFRTRFLQRTFMNYYYHYYKSYRRITIIGKLLNDPSIIILHTRARCSVVSIHALYIVHRTILL